MHHIDSMPTAKIASVARVDAARFMLGLATARRPLPTSIEVREQALVNARAMSKARTCGGCLLRSDDDRATYINAWLEVREGYGV